VINIEDLDSIDDPLALFQLATDAISQRRDEIDRLAEIRARSIAAMYARGTSYKEIASTLGLSTPRVGQLVSSNDAAAIEILKAWAAIESTMSDFPSPPGARNRNIYQDALRVLRKSKRFGEAALRDLDYVRSVRNAVVHGRGPLDIEEAELVTDKAIYLNSLMRVILHDLKTGDLPSRWTAPESSSPQRERRSRLSRGESLPVGHSLYSPDGRTRFTLQEDGNAVVFVDGLGDICDTGTANHGIPKCLKLEDDGWLIIYGADGKELWKKGPNGYRLNVQDNSHVVLYPSKGDAIWATDAFIKAGRLVQWIPPESRLQS